MKNKQRPPLTYYGGKQQLVNKILPLIPDHLLYTEVFFGGGAVFFAKESVQSVINDKNNNLINFYRQLKENGKALIQRIQASLYSEEEHRLAKKIYFDKISAEETHFSPSTKMKLEKAWAVFMLSHLSFLRILGNCWHTCFSKRFDRNVISNNPKRFSQKTINLVLNEYGKRLENTSIFNNDALKVLKKADKEHSFHYIDPPYINTNCGHYSGYTEDDFENLLKTCSELKGKFMLSSFPSDILEFYTLEYGWKTIKIEKAKSASQPNSNNRKKIEVITMNY